MAGRIEVICGGMFSGKTEELIRRLRRAQIAKQKVLLFKPKKDQRYHAQNVVSHSGLEMSASPLGKSEEIPTFIWDLHNLDQAAITNPMWTVGMNAVIGIDEAQFFDEGLPAVVQKLADQNFRVVVAGLELDSNREPFGVMPTLMCLAESVTKLRAVCIQCGQDAAFSQRLSKNTDTVLVGGTESYEPRCRSCYRS